MFNRGRTMGLGEKSDGNGVWILCWYGVDGMKESHFKSFEDGST